MRKFQKIAAIMLMTAVVFAVGCTPEENKDSDVKVTTYTPQDITSTTAVCGGDVIVIQGLSLTELGVCWGKDSKPTVEDSHRSTSKWSEPYVCTITGLEPGTKYHVRAYALRGLEYYYGDDKSFTTAPLPSYIVTLSSNPIEGGTITGSGTYEQGQSCTVTATANAGYTFANWTENGGQVSTDATYTFTVDADRTLVANFTYTGGDEHDYVDLGLPSGTLWATCNVGANAFEKYGDYFAWGETAPKDVYSWSTYQYYDGGNLVKYTGSDGLTTLLPEDDAATANWGNGWRMPTKEEWQELYQNTTNTWTTQNGMNGRLFTAPNGNSLFLPAAGCRWDGYLDNVGSYGDYWSSSLYTDYPDDAWDFGFLSDYCRMSYYRRDYGLSVRAVRSTRQN